MREGHEELVGKLEQGLKAFDRSIKRNKLLRRIRLIKKREKRVLREYEREEKKGEIFRSVKGFVLTLVGVGLPYFGYRERERFLERKPKEVYVRILISGEGLKVVNLTKRALNEGESIQKIKRGLKDKGYRIFDKEGFELRVKREIGLMALGRPKIAKN